MFYYIINKIKSSKEGSKEPSKCSFKKCRYDGIGRQDGLDEWVKAIHTGSLISKGISSKVSNSGNP